MLLQNYGSVESGMGPMLEWSQSDTQAHIDFQIALNRELMALGELVDAQGLVAGYRLIDVASLDRAIEIAARASAAPGIDGAPVQQTIEVREVFGPPET